MGGEYRRGPALPQLGEGSRTPQPVAANRAPATGPLWRSSQIRRPGSDPAPALYGEHMTERRGDPGFTVATQRLGGDGGPRRSRTRRIGLGLVESVTNSDYTYVQSVATLLAVGYTVLFILADLLVVLLVPKLRAGATS